MKDGILKGMYKFRASKNKKAKLKAQLFGSGSILREALQAQEILETKYNVAADVWSITSYKSLYTDGIETERWNRLHPGSKPRVPYVTKTLGDAPGVLVAASDYLKTLPNMISKWLPRRLASLGTDGFGRSEGRQSLRTFFEVDARSASRSPRCTSCTSTAKLETKVLDKAIKDLGINPEKPNPVTSVAGQSTASDWLDYRPSVAQDFATSSSDSPRRRKSYSLNSRGSTHASARISVGRISRSIRFGREESNLERRGRFRVFVNDSSDRRRFQKRRAQLLAQLPAKADFVALPLLHLPAGKFPFQRRRIASPPLPDQQSPIRSFDHRSHYD